jgi:hypothetical protein
MEIKYGIFNPTTGQYEYDNDLDTTFNKITDLAFQFYMNHTHNAPMSKITINDDGSETWEAINITMKNNGMYEITND